MITIEVVHHDSRLKYLNEHGHHFNEHTLKYAVDHMYYLDKGGQEAKIIPSTESDLYRLLRDYDVYINNWNLYDCLYVLNMAKADFLDSSLEDEKHLILYVKDLIDDPDGYEGLVFNRWCADLEGKDIKLDWHDFI